MGGGPQITLNFDDSDFNRKITEQRVRIREAKALVSSLNREIDQTARKGQQVTGDVVGRLQAAEARLSQEKQALGNLTLDAAIGSVGPRRGGVDDDEDEGGISFGQVKKGFKKAKKFAKAAYRLYDAIALRDAIDALNSKEKQEFEEDDNQLHKANTLAAKNAEKALKQIQAVETISRFAGPVGRAAGFVVGTIARELVEHGEKLRNEAVQMSDAQDIFKAENINSNPAKTAATRLDEFIKAGGSLDVIKDVVRFSKEHAKIGLQAALRGDVVRAQKEFDRVNKAESEAKIFVGSASFGSPVEIFLSNDRAHAFHKRWVATQYKRNVWRIGD